MPTSNVSPMERIRGGGLRDLLRESTAERSDRDALRVAPALTTMLAFGLLALAPRP